MSTIIKQYELQRFLTEKDIKNIASQTKRSEQTIRCILRGTVKRSDAMALCFEVAELRKIEKQKEAKKIINNNKNNKMINIKSTKNEVLTAVAQNGWALEYASDALRNEQETKKN